MILVIALSTTQYGLVVLTSGVGGMMAWQLLCDLRNLYYRRKWENLLDLTKPLNSRRKSK